MKTANTILDKEPDPGPRPVLVDSQDERDSGAVPSLSSLVTCKVSTLGIHLDQVAALADSIEQQLTALVPCEQGRQTLYTSAGAILILYIEQGAQLASIETLASLTRRTRARIQSALKQARTASIRGLLKLATALDKPYTLTTTPLAKETAKQALERAFDTMAEYLVNRLAEDDTAHQDARTEPINLQIRRKAAALREYGYVLNEDGLYSTRLVEDTEMLTLIGKLHVDVTAKRHIYTVPEYITERPKEQGVVLVTRFSPLANRKAGQTIEIHRSDMQARQPKFIEQLQVVVPPHKKKRDDLIHALEAMGMAAPVENRYNSTGLVRPDETFIFLHPAGGGLTERGLDEQHKIQFPMSVASRLTSIQYGWTRASTPSECIADYETLLQITGIAPGSTGYGDVLLGIHGFAPMSQLCDTGGVWVIDYGSTGSFKSATSRLPLQGYAHGFYGRQETSTINLREGASTAYAIEQVLYYLAGMFAHLDDGLKGNNVPPKDVEKFYKLLSTIGGHAVTKQGGKRGVWGQGEGGFGIEPYPRGSGIYTVETLPASEGHASDLARYIVVALDGAHCVDTILLDRLQSLDAAAHMNRATCSYIQWLLPRMDGILAGIPGREDIYREQGVHTRTPTSYAKLETGLAALLQYGVSIGAHTEHDAIRLLAEARARLVQVALKQKELMGIDEQSAGANDVVQVFYKLLHEAMRAPAHKVYLTDTVYRPITEFTSGGAGEVTLGHRPQPPVFLTNEAIDHGLASMPDSYGWKYNESLRVYEPLGVEAGVLKWDGVKPTLHMYARDFKEVVYPALVKLAESQQIPAPGLNEMIGKLKDKGKLTSAPSNTNLHGRGSRSAGVYILDMTPVADITERDSAALDTERRGLDTKVEEWDPSL